MAVELEVESDSRWRQDPTGGARVVEGERGGKRQSGPGEGVGPATGLG